MDDERDTLNPSTKTLVWISGIIAFLFTANQGVGVTGFLLDWGPWGFVIMLVRNVLLAGAVIFAVLYITREIIRR